MMDGSEVRAVDEALSAVFLEIVFLKRHIAVRKADFAALTDRDLEVMVRKVAAKLVAIADHIAEISADRIKA